MGYRICIELEVHLAPHLDDPFQYHEVISKKLEQESGYGDQLWKDWCGWDTNRQANCKAVSARYPGVTMTLEIEDSTGEQWEETYLDGEQIGEDNMESVSQNALGELKEGWAELVAAHPWIAKVTTAQKLVKAIEVLT